MAATKTIIDVENDLRAMVAEILEIEPEEVGLQANFVKDLGMDSMMALELLATIEKKYRIIVPEGILPKFTSLEITANIVRGILKEDNKI